MRNNIRYLKDTYQIAGVPGLLLLFYPIVLGVFARAKSDANAIDLSAIVFACYAMGAGMYCYRKMKKEESPFFNYIIYKSPVTFFCLYTLWCFISFLWSPSMTLTAYRSVECLGLLMVIVATIDRLVQKTDVDGLVLWSVVYAFLIVMIDFLIRTKIDFFYALYRTQFSSTLFFYLVFFYSPKKWITIPVMALALLSHSTTGYIGIALGLTSLLFGGRKIKKWGIILMFGLFIAISSYGIDTVLNNTIFSTKTEVMENGEFQMSKTTGRDKIWVNALNQVDKKGKQLIGLGFVAGETSLSYNLLGQGVIGMHNGFLSAYVGTGLIGLLFFSLFILGYIWTCFSRVFQDKIRTMIIASMCVVFAHTMANPGLGFRVYGTWMPAMFIVIMTLGIKYAIFYDNSQKEDKAI